MVNYLSTESSLCHYLQEMSEIAGEINEGKSSRRRPDNVIIMESGPLKGAKLSTGSENKLTTRSCPDVDRWQTSLGNELVGPDVAGSLERFKLDNFRYISTLEDAAVASLSNLAYLSLTRCSQLSCLPESIGSLKNLKTVR